MATGNRQSATRGRSSSVPQSGHTTTVRRSLPGRTVISVPHSGAALGKVSGPALGTDECDAIVPRLRSEVPVPAVRTDHRNSNVLGVARRTQRQRHEVFVGLVSTGLALAGGEPNQVTSLDRNPAALKRQKCRRPIEDDEHLLLVQMGVKATRKPLSRRNPVVVNREMSGSEDVGQPSGSHSSPERRRFHRVP
jgi:hypothetical protein